MSGRADPAAMLREHFAAPGAAIVPTAPIDWRQRWNPSTATWCAGELRAMYVREDKRWIRVGYTCLRCGVVELHADVLPLDKPGQWHYNKSDRARRPGAVLVPGTLAAAPTTETTVCPDCNERVTSSNLARHRRRRHSTTSPAVDTVSPATAVDTAEWAPGELMEAHGR